MTRRFRSSSILFSLCVWGLLCAAPALATPQDEQAERPVFASEVRPILELRCFDCHGAQQQKSDFRVDVLDPDLVTGGDAEAWHHVLDMLQGGDMPPAKAEQPTDEERRTLVAWLTASLREAAIAREGERRAVLRRLTKAQYTHSLQELLGLPIDFGRVLPDDGKSKMGFSNNGEVLQASALHLDYYQAIAREALDQALALGERPAVHRYRVTFGKGSGQDLVAGHTGGYQSVPLDTDDFVVAILDEQGLERVGANEAEQAALDDVKRRISVGLRGSSQSRFRVVDEGMILYGARPHVEKVPRAWQGPSPNLKLELQRVFPERGDFVLRVRASRGFLVPSDELLLIDLEDPRPVAGIEPESESEGARVLRAADSDERENLVAKSDVLVPEQLTSPSSARFQLELAEAGYFQIDLVHPVVTQDAMPSVRLTLDKLTLDKRLELSAEQLLQERAVSALGAAYVPPGKRTLKVGGPFFVGFSHVVLTPLSKDHPAVAPLTAELEGLAAAVAGKTPSLRAFVGTRTDDGMDYKTFHAPREVHAPLGAAATYTFHGRLENLPIPEPESGDDEILSGFLLLGVWNDHLVKSPADPGPPLLIESIEFEAPFLPAWPPASRHRIFFPSPYQAEQERYTREVVASFAERAFRRPVEDTELERYLAFWRELKDEHATYEEGVREVLVAVLCSPHFLYLAEPKSDTLVEGALPEGALSQDALAARLSYFLWNSPPDGALRRLARQDRLEEELETEVDRMLADARVWRFVRAFTREWLRLDRHELMTVNPDAYPALTRFVKRDMAEETVRFFQHVLHQDLSLLTLIDSDFAMLNQNLAEFYGVEGVVGASFRPVPITPEQRRGGLLSQGSFLSGHSDGTQAHPIKRAVWLKGRLLGDPPPPPPPNVPDLDPQAAGFEGLTLKQQLEKHRDNPSCHDCHAGIDPFGIVFERFDASGIYREERDGEPIDDVSVLPDGTEVQGLRGMQRYLLEQESDAFAAALIEHLFAYALGRDVLFADEEELAGILEGVRASGYGMRSVIRGIVTSPSFTRP